MHKRFVLRQKVNSRLRASLVITFEGATFAEVEQAFRDSIDDYLAFCAQRGEPPDRPYSGKIALRVSPETHRRRRALRRRV